MELAGYLADDVLLLDTANLRPQTGDCVAAIVHAWPHPSTTVIVREFQHSPPVDLLVTRSLTTRIASTIVLDHDRVKLLGVFLPHRLRLPT